MKIVRKSILLADKVNANLFQVDGPKLWEEFKMGVCNHLQIINNLSSIDIDSLSDIEFFNYLSMLYDFNLTKKDELDLLSQRYAQKFDRIAEISTSMVISDDVGQKNRLTWEQLFQVKFIVAVAQGKNIDLTKVYSKDEIELMLENNDIIILDKVIEKIDYCGFDREEAEEFSIENISVVLASIIRRNICREDIDRDIDAYYNELFEHIEDVASICSKLERDELLGDLKDTIDRAMIHDSGLKRS